MHISLPNCYLVEGAKGIKVGLTTVKIQSFVMLMKIIRLEKSHIILDKLRSGC